MTARVSRLAMFLLLGIATARIASTYAEYTQTYDEGPHIAAGMEWLARGSYTYEALHPPLARVAVALGPYLVGAASHGFDLRRWQGSDILESGGHYKRNLALARLGVLPFFLLAASVVFAWTSSIASRTAGVIAVLAFTTLPPVLAHAGLATTDMAAAATIALALWSFTCWLQQPTRLAAALLGAAVGLALLAKLSALVFLPASAIAIAAAYLVRSPATKQFTIGARARGLITAGLVASMTVWAAYRFSVGAPIMRPINPVDVAAAPGPLRQALRTVARLRIFPAPEYLQGILQVREINASAGRKNYVLGSPGRGGRWYFFPLALLVKTPLPFLALAVVGIVLGLTRRASGGALAPALVAGAMLGVAILSDINIGLRHLLPIYPVLAVCVGVAAFALLRDMGPTTGRVALTLVLGWQIIGSARAHPDYLPWFNELAGSHADELLVDSDLDWGQDLGRLVDTLRARQIPRISITYHGTADLSRRGLPPYRLLRPYTPTSGWVAASIFRIKLGDNDTTFDAYAWLRCRTPVTRVGYSILLYHIPEDAIHSSCQQTATTRPWR